MKNKGEDEVRRQRLTWAWHWFRQDGWQKSLQSGDTETDILVRCNWRCDCITVKSEEEKKPMVPSVYWIPNEILSSWWIIVYANTLKILSNPEVKKHDLLVLIQNVPNSFDLESLVGDRPLIHLWRNSKPWSWEKLAVTALGQRQLTTAEASQWLTERDPFIS